MKALLSRLIDYAQAKLPPNRIVVLLTPLIFVPAAGFVSAWVAKNIPGVTLDPALVAGAFVAGGAAALTTAYRWLDGWQQREARLARWDPGHDRRRPNRRPKASVNGGAAISPPEAE